MLKEKVNMYIGKIRAIEGVRGCALISRDGIMLGQSMDGDFNEPWLAAMCATLFASAESASGILGIPPRKMSVSAEVAPPSWCSGQARRSSSLSWAGAVSSALKEPGLWKPSPGRSGGLSDVHHHGHR